MKIEREFNFTTKDRMNVKTSQSLESAAGMKLNIVSAAIGTDIDSATEEEILTGYLKNDKGEYYSTKSPTARESIEDVIDILSDGEDCVVTVLQRESKAGRKFLQLRVE